MRRRVVVYSLLALTATASITAGCSGGKGGGSSPVPTSTSVENVLDRLGVNRNLGDRVSPTGATLPTDFVPFGPSTQFNRVDEIYTLGIGLKDPANVANDLPGKEHFVGSPAGTTSLLDAQSTDPAWTDGHAQTQHFTQSTRTAVAADLDGTGRDETVVAWVDPGDPMHNDELQLAVHDDELAASPFGTTTSVATVQPGIVDVNASAGDFNGDGLDDLAVGVDIGSQAKLFFVVNTNGALTIDNAATLTFTPTLANAPMTIRMASAQLDYDASKELVVVVDEFDDNGGTQSGVATYYVYDDEQHGRALLKTGLVQGTDGGVYTAIVADVAAGDIDGDGLDEIVFGGITAYQTTCTTYDYISVALDDGAHGFAAYGARHQSEQPSQCSDVSPFKIRWVFVNMVDLDGDAAKEVAVNNFVYASWKTAAPFTLAHNLGYDAFLPTSQATAGGWADRSTVSMAAGDVNADGKQDILVYGQSQNDIFVFGTNPVTQVFGQIGTIPVTFSNMNNSDDEPLLVTVNVNDDTPTLKYSPGTYKLIFTEPILLAALAAAPCADGIGQNTGACATTFGTATSSTTTVDQVLSVSASASIGFHVTGGVFTQSELEMKATLSTEASSTTGNAYTLTQSVNYTTGSLEDSVIFTTVPEDTWTYTVVSHPDPTMIGQEVTIALPRPPITLIAERNFFNGALRPTDEPIGTNVFTHTVGDLSSYPTAADKDAILQQYGGLQTPAQSVGQGTSATQIGLAVGTEYTTGHSLTLGFELDVECTAATVLGGFTVGASAENSLSVTSGTETNYTGSVGSIDSAHFAGNQYSFGLFTYKLPDPNSNREFEVLNYWVQ